MVRLLKTSPMMICQARGRETAICLGPSIKDVIWITNISSFYAFQNDESFTKDKALFLEVLDIPLHFRDIWT